MELKNFALTDNIYLTVEGSTFDLHNRFSFHHLEYDIFARRLVLSWENGQVFPPLGSGDLQYIKLVFEGVYFFRCRESMQNIPAIQESDYVMNSAEFVRWLPDMRDAPWDGWEVTAESQGKTHLLLSFCLGSALMIGAGTAQCELLRCE